MELYGTEWPLLWREVTSTQRLAMADTIACPRGTTSFPGPLPWLLGRGGRKGARGEVLGTRLHEASEANVEKE